MVGRCARARVRASFSVLSWLSLSLRNDLMCNNELLCEHVTRIYWPRAQCRAFRSLTLFCFSSFNLTLLSIRMQLILDNKRQRQLKLFRYYFSFPFSILSFSSLFFWCLELYFLLGRLSVAHSHKFRCVVHSSSVFSMANPRAVGTSQKSDFKSDVYFDATKYDSWWIHYNTHTVPSIEKVKEEYLMDHR